MSMAEDSDAAAYTSNVTMNDRLDLALEEVQRLYQKYDLSEELDRDNLHVGVANWKRRNGLCKYHKSLSGRRVFGERVPSLNRTQGNHVILINERMEHDSDFIETVRHELAHAIAYAVHGSSQGHNKAWKVIASKLGAEPKSCAHNEKGTEYEYFMACPNCGWKDGKVRLSKRIKRADMYRCGDCDTFCVSYDADKEMPQEPGTKDVDRLQS